MRVDARGDRSGPPSWPAGLLPLLACACTSIPPAATAETAGPHFSVPAFFAGDTEGAGTLKVMFAKDRPITVHGRGAVGDDGVLVLDQTVDDAGDRPRQRRWRIRQTAVDRYAGTLSDAHGPVLGDVTGNRLHLRFAMKGGLDADQWLSLRSGGRVADNVMVVRKLGITVATLHEIIRKID